MIKGFVFNGNRSWDLGIEAELVSCPLSAEPKNVFIDIPTADGELDLSAANPLRRVLYKPRIIEFYCHVSFDPVTEYPESKAAEIAAALCTDEDAILRIAGASPFVYMGRAASLYNITLESDTSFSFPLVFKCQPFRWADSPSDAESVGGPLIVQNDGLATDFCLSIDGAVSGGIVIRSSAYPEKELHIPSAETGLVIVDSANMAVSFNRVDITSSCSGEFFDIAPGENIIAVECASSQIQLSINYTKKYL